MEQNSESRAGGRSGAITGGPCFKRGSLFLPGAMTTAQLEAEMMKLPRSIRARLAERLIESLDEDSEIERGWADEADKRYHAYLKGDESAFPLEDFMAAVRKEFSL